MNASVFRLKEQVSAVEWEWRKDLAACYRLVALYGWDDLIFTHISARIPGPERHFLINPYGMLFDEITASSLVKVGSLAYHDYEGIALHDDEKPRIVRDLGDKRLLMLRNHGLLTVGRTVSEAFVSMYMLETSCMIQLRAQASPNGLINLAPPIVERGGAQFDQVLRGTGGGLAWPALLRKLDRLDATYNS
jgi:ribulose-5-phosphate 4-epimerase/fuculose-1-phosphate aldolase